MEEKKNDTRKQDTNKRKELREDLGAGNAAITRKRSFLPGRGSNKWFLVGLIHGLLLAVIAILRGIPMGILDDYFDLIKLFLVLFVFIAFAFIIYALLVALAGRAGKQVGWLFAFIVSIVFTFSMAGQLELPEMTIVTIFLLFPVLFVIIPVVLVPLILFTVIALFVGILIQIIYEKVKRNKEDTGITGKE